VARGGTVLTSVHVGRLLMRGDRVAGVVGSVVDPDHHARTYPVRITARATILAAGAVGTPVIVQDSGVRREAIGANFRMHPSAVMMGRFGEEVLPWSGATQGYHSLQFERSGLKLEWLWPSLGVMVARLPVDGAEYMRQLANLKDMALFDGWTAGDSSSGRVRSVARRPTDISYQLSDVDVRRLQDAHARLAERLVAAGAEEVLSGIRGLPDVLPAKRAVDSIRDATLTGADFATGSNHIFGTMAMGDDPERHACDSWGKVHGVEDLYVCDTSLKPGSPGTNPMLTLMAHRLGEELPQRCA